MNTSKFPHHQRGVTLLIAMIVLVAMTLAGIALVRSVDTAALLAGNLAFKQSAASSADRGMETALAVLTSMTASQLEGTGSPSGYSATVPWDTVANKPSPLDFSGNATPTATDNFSWSAAAAVAADDADNSADYMIHRLCQGTGALDVATCTTWSGKTDPVHGVGILNDQLDYDPNKMEVKPATLRGVYRVTVRVNGPRNTANYIQAIVIR